MRSLVVCLLLIPAAALADATPATKYWEGEHLARVRDATDLRPEVRSALRELRHAASAALDNGPYTVVDKSIVPPSGDKHDYLSFSRYWWPNPETADGLPYVRRDGRVNRERVAMGDRVTIGSFCSDVEMLALAAYLLQEERYGDRATHLLRVWFLNDATRMNPNLNYAQGVPGRADGRAPGVLDARHFISVLDGVEVLEAAGAIDQSTLRGLRAWFGEYLDWLLQSDLGTAERRAKNNHGFWYAAQTARVALFVGRSDVAREILIEVRDKKLPESIRPDGSQPEEVKRTLSLHYSLFSLSAISVVARIGEDLDVDLWNHTASSGAGFRAAFLYAGPYAARQGAWNHPMLKDYRLSDRQAALFYLSGSRLDEPRAAEWLSMAPRKPGEVNLTPLLFAYPAEERP